jgi:hypothetical protein
VQDDPKLHQLEYIVGKEVRTGTIKEYLEDVYDFDYDLRWWAMGMLVLFVLVLRFIVALATKYVHFQKR